MNAFPSTFCIIDTETSGMRPPFSRIIDLGIIRVEKGEVVERYQTLLNPGVSLPPFITGITNLTDNDLVDAPTFEEVAVKVQEILSDAVFVAHNASFDYAFVKSEFERIDMPFKAETLCSVRLSRKLFPQERTHNLDAIIKRHDIRIKERHRALPDAEAVWQFFSRIENQVDPEALSLAVAHARQGAAPNSSRSSAPLPKDTFTDLPNSAGVYFFYGPEQELLYIGKSKNVRNRARSHFTKSAKDKEEHLQLQTSSVQSVKTSGELSALILESALIKSESPVYNRALRKKRKLVTALREIGEDGYARVSIVATDALNPDPNILSVFRNTTQAKGVLRKIAKETKLCPKTLGLEKGLGECFAHQLGNCDGACAGKIDVGIHNTRLDEAFDSRRLRVWPYKGVVMIDERENATCGTVFFIDNWTLTGAFRYEDETYAPFAEELVADIFDYDNYKILARYMLNPRNKKAIKILTPSEYRRQLAVCTGFENSDYPDNESVIN